MFPNFANYVTRDENVNSYQLLEFVYPAALNVSDESNNCEEAHIPPFLIIMGIIGHNNIDSFDDKMIL
ncbi:MAG: hypothetical protein [Moriyavirus koyama]|uniref:Uncharacterized protein n=1 Tax=Bacteriophage sp. TaxID=38018 RepID=A0ABY5TT73_9VIRU|nr:MAG: hypothetical protein [Bacteriophage sp.]